MRELTWKEKIIDSQSDNAISKWGEALEDLLENLPKTEYLCHITLKRGKKFKVTITNLSKKDDKPCIEYKVTSNLPKLAYTARKVFKEILEENGIEEYCLLITKEELSINVTDWI